MSVHLRGLVTSNLVSASERDHLGEKPNPSPHESHEGEEYKYRESEREHLPNPSPHESHEGKEYIIIRIARQSREREGPSERNLTLARMTVVRAKSISIISIEREGPSERSLTLQPALES